MDRGLEIDLLVPWTTEGCDGRAGLSGVESGTFWPFVERLDELGQDKPEAVVLENVVGLATSHGGDDLAAAVRAFNDLGYSVDVLSIDARRFLPQSRPRLFLVAGVITTFLPPLLVFIALQRQFIQGLTRGALAN